VKTPTTLRPTRRQQDLIVVPEARPPRRWGLTGAIVAGALAAVLVGGVIGFAIADNRAKDRIDEAVAAVVLENQQAAAAAEAIARQQVSQLQGQVDGMEQRLADLRAANRVVNASKREARSELDATRADLDEARAGLRAVQGPPVDDGTHIVRIVAVGPSQAQPRIIVQMGHWFTGDAADAAAIADGFIPPGQTLASNRYFRPGEGVWRTVKVSPTAPVTVRRFSGSLGGRVVGLAGLERILRMDAAWARRVAHDPFWITVDSGTVTALQQQRYP
jgi:hypothetical protein